jgi:hypothetical protein
VFTERVGSPRESLHAASVVPVRCVALGRGGDGFALGLYALPYGL